jgi:hypothetical protein
MLKKAWYVFLLVVASAFLLLGLYRLLFDEFSFAFLPAFVFWGFALWFAVRMLRSARRPPPG